MARKSVPKDVGNDKGRWKGTEISWIKGRGQFVEVDGRGKRAANGLLIVLSILAQIILVRLTRLEMEDVPTGKA